MIYYTRNLEELYDDDISEPRKRLNRNPAITCSFNRSIESCVFVSFPRGTEDYSFYRTVRFDTFEERIKRLNYSNHSKKQKWEF